MPSMMPSGWSFRTERCLTLLPAPYRREARQRIEQVVSASGTTASLKTLFRRPDVLNQQLLGECDSEQMIQAQKMLFPKKGSAEYLNKSGEQTALKPELALFSFYVTRHLVIVQA